MDRLDLVNALAKLPREDYASVLAVAETVRGGIVTSINPTTVPAKFASTPKRKGGRPKGSKNKPKTMIAVDIETPVPTVETNFPPVPDTYGVTDGGNVN